MSASERNEGPASGLADDDHRSLAGRLDLWHFQDEAPGMVFWHPAGWQLYRLLEEAVRRVTVAQGYTEVRTPQLLRRAIWEASGHWQHFQAGMFRVDDQAVEAAIKPVSCPGHLSLLRRQVLSYRDLPLRLSELGLVHRDEPGGTLHGLMRLRQFTQDDGHVFCTEEQAEAELERFCEAVPRFYRAFGFAQIAVALSTRPPSRAGDDALWDRAEGALEAVLRRLEIPFVVQPGAGAFYGPKLEYSLRDRLGRDWQCGTIQFDLVMPDRFGVSYVDRGGDRKPPVMLHRALYGSLERFLAILLEHHGRALPGWLAPVQAVVLPVATEQEAAARELAARLSAAGLRVTVEIDETLSKRIARATAVGTPFQIVLGAREVAAGAITVRGRDGQRTLAMEAGMADLTSRCAPPALVG